MNDIITGSAIDSDKTICRNNSGGTITESSQTTDDQPHHNGNIHEDNTGGAITKSSQPSAPPTDGVVSIKPPARFVHTKLPLKGLYSLAVWGAAFISAILLFGILSQCLHYYSIVASLPVASQWLFMICGGICTIVILAVLAKIAMLFFRFRRSDNLDLQAVKLLNERSDWQYYAAATDQATQAREKLGAYLAEFDLDNKDTEKLFVEYLRMDRKDYEDISTARRKLLAETNPNSGSDPITWLKQFQNDFQSKLDTLAQNRVSQYYYRVLAGTAISPRALVDQIIITSACVGLIHDLLQIYHLKPAPGQTLFLAAHAFFNIYAGGEMQEKVENVVEHLSDKAGEIGGELFNNEETAAVFGPTIVGAIPWIGNGMQFAAAKIAEGTMNALLIRNLGKKMIQWLQPTRPQ